VGNLTTTNKKSGKRNDKNKQNHELSLGKKSDIRGHNYLFIIKMQIRGVDE
jgi:hypothetical protein